MSHVPNKVKLQALEASTYCPKYSDEKAIDSITMEEFDVEKIKDHIRTSIELLSYSRSHKMSMIEILDVLNENKHIFLIDKQKYISFYWSGILIYRITILKGVAENKQLHVSLQKYKIEKEAIASEKTTQKLIMIGLGGSLLVGSIIALVTVFRKKE